jgi:hypothetical protein
MLRTVASAFFLSVLVFQAPAQAYIDPGTGSLILQGLVALFVGAVFTLKTFFYERVKPVIDWILRRPKPTPSTEPPPAPGASPDTHKE